MPKLYNHEGSWQIPGQQDRKARRVDVPSSPAELAAWLNDRNVTADETAALAFASEALAVTGRGPLTDDELGAERLYSSTKGGGKALALARETIADLADRPPAGPRVPGVCDSCGRLAAATVPKVNGTKPEFCLVTAVKFKLRICSR